MSTDYLERLKVRFVESPHPLFTDADFDDLRALLAEAEKLRAGSIPLMTLRQAWRNGWTDRGNAIRQAVADSNGERDAYERAFVRYMSEDPAEDDKDPYRPVDGPDDPAFDHQAMRDGVQ